MFLDEHFLASRSDAVRNRDESKDGQERCLVVLAIEAIHGTVKPRGEIGPLIRVMTPEPLDRLINVWLIHTDKNSHIPGSAPGTRPERPSLRLQPPVAASGHRLSMDSPAG